MLSLGRRTAFILAIFGLLIGCDSGGGSGSNQAPDVTISSPGDGTEFTSAETISFEGSADDPEDGSLTGDALDWSSSADGDLGSGEQVETSSLSATQHTITLTATDSEGATGTDSLSLTVQDASPTASISSPANETPVDQESTVEFEGTGTSADGDELSGDALEWSSDVDDQLGTGESISVMDLSQGPHTITLTVTDDEGNSASESIDIVVESPGFTPRIHYADDFTESQKTTIQDALGPWAEAITGDLVPSFPSFTQANDCDLEREGIDDLAVAVTKGDLDGPGGALAQAGPCLVRVDEDDNFITSISGVVTIDEADLNNSQLERIVTHEIGHVLGIGIEQLKGWGSNVSDLNTRDPFHAGPNTSEAFDQMGGEAYLSEGVPVANEGGFGTRGGHWREANFDTELMTGFINSGTFNPLSRVSLASVADVGYEVDLSTADSYSLPMPQEAIWLAGADATLSRDALASENFGEPSESRLGSALVAGANADSLWSDEAPEDEVFSSLVQFGLPSSAPTGVDVEQAGLQLTVDERRTDANTHSVEIFPVSESWAEDMVTSDNGPAVEDSSVATFGYDSCDECQEDVTGLATDWLNGDTPNYGVALRAPDASSEPTFSVGFVSRHSDAITSRPRILVQASTSETGLDARPRRKSGEKIFLGDDIRSGMIYGISPDGRVVRTKRLR